MNIESMVVQISLYCNDLEVHYESTISIMHHIPSANIILAALFGMNVISGGQQGAVTPRGLQRSRCATGSSFEVPGGCLDLSNCSVSTAAGAATPLL